jgi:hypothetical protein
MMDAKRLDELDQVARRICSQEAIEHIRLARLGLWAREHGVPAMRRGSRWLDGIKYDLEASVYTLTDDEFETVFSTRDDLDLALAALPEEGE